MKPLKIKGTPIQSSDWSVLPGKDRVCGFLRDDHFSIEFNVVSPIGDDRIGFNGAEFLLGMSVNLPDDIRFGIVREGFLNLHVKGWNIPLGKLPMILTMFFDRHWEDVVEQGKVEAEKYEIGFSTIGREVDKNQVMANADLVESMPESEFQKLLGELNSTLAEIIYTVKIGLRVENLPSIEPVLMGSGL